MSEMKRVLEQRYEELVTMLQRGIVEPAGWYPHDFNDLEEEMDSHEIEEWLWATTEDYVEEFGTFSPVEPLKYAKLFGVEGTTVTYADEFISEGCKEVTEWLEQLFKELF